MNYKLGLFLVFFLIFSRVSFAGTIESEEKILEKVTKNNGKILTTNSLPAFTNILIPHLDSLSDAHNKLRESEMSLSSTIYVLESDNVNAFVITQREDGKTRGKNMIFI